jgi:hypothetical protein
MNYFDYIALFIHLTNVFTLGRVLDNDIFARRQRVGVGLNQPN